MEYIVCLSADLSATTAVARCDSQRPVQRLSQQLGCWNNLVNLKRRYKQIRRAIQSYTCIMANLTVCYQTKVILTGRGRFTETSPQFIPGQVTVHANSCRVHQVSNYNHDLYLAFTWG